MVGKFACEICGKEYKRKSGLSKHVSTKHETTIHGLTVAELETLCTETQSTLITNMNYTKHIHDAVRNSKIDHGKLLNQISLPYKVLEETSDGEQFMAKIFAYTVRYSSKWILCSSPQVANLIMKNLVDKIFCHYKKTRNPQTTTINIDPITKDCMEGIQYLSGYVIRKLKGKFQDSTILAVLENMVSSLIGINTH